MAVVKNVLNQISHGLCEIAFFAIAFTLIGYYVPEIYYKYFDRTQYYVINNPVIVEGDIHRVCDNVTVEIHRKSLINTQAVSVRELVLVKNNVEVARYKSDLAITLDQDVVHAEWNLPCTIKPGEYNFRGIVTYKFRGNEKSVMFYSTDFEVLPLEVKKK